MEKSRVFPVVPSVRLPLQKDLVDTVTKGELARVLYPELIYDIAYPNGFIQAMMDAVIPESYFPRWESISLAYRRTFSFGVVWGYPKDGFGSICGYPAPLTLDAYRLILHFYNTHGDYSPEYYEVEIEMPNKSLELLDVELKAQDEYHNFLTKQAKAALSEMR